MVGANVLSAPVGIILFLFLVLLVSKMESFPAGRLNVLGFPLINVCYIVSQRALCLNIAASLCSPFGDL